MQISDNMRKRSKAKSKGQRAILNEKHHCQRGRSTRKIDLAKLQPADCHSFACRVNKTKKVKTLLIVDLQNDFLPGGAISVPHGNEIIPVLNQIIPKFSLILATKDWHPENHVSFAANHPGKKIGDTARFNGIDQILWPVHCVQNSRGSELSPELQADAITAIFYKGTDPSVDSYSAFFDNARKKSTGLSEFLRSRKIKEFFIAGLAVEYCILYTAIDAVEEGFQPIVIKDCCRGINLKKGDEERAFKKMRDAGVEVITSNDV